MARFVDEIIMDVFGRPMVVKKRIDEPGDINFERIGHWSAKGMI